jgi:hypothetical protein
MMSIVGSHWMATMKKRFVMSQPSDQDLNSLLLDQIGSGKCHFTDKLVVYYGESQQLNPYGINDF